MGIGMRAGRTMSTIRGIRRDRRARITIVLVLALTVAGGVTSSWLAAGADASRLGNVRLADGQGAGSTNGVVLTDEQIVGALLPAEAVENAEASSATFPAPDETGGTCGAPNVTARAAATGSVASGIVAYDTDPMLDVGIGEAIFAFSTPADAKRFMAATRDDLSCTSYKANGSTFAVTQLPLAHFGDESTAQREAVTETSGDTQRGTLPPATITERVFVRLGNHVLVLERWAPYRDVNELRIYTRTALHRLRDALTSASAPPSTSPTVSAEPPTPPADALLPPGTPLADGLVVAPGTQLIGAVFPATDYGTDGTGWTALLWIDQDPIQAFDAYVEQARRLGFAVPGSASCSFIKDSRPLAPDAATTEQADEIRCREGATSPGATDTTSIDLVLRYGRSSNFLMLQMTGDGAPSSGAVDPNFARASTPPVLPALTPAKLATKPGAPFGTKNDAFDSGYRRFHLERGSRLAAPVADLAGDYDFVAVLQVTGNAKKVLRGYARQLAYADFTPPRIVTLTTSEGERVLAIANAPLGGGYGLLQTDADAKWIYVQAQSD